MTILKNHVICVQFLQVWNVLLQLFKQSPPVSPARLGGAGLDPDRHRLGPGRLWGLRLLLAREQEAQLMLTVQGVKQLGQLVTHVAVVVQDPVHLQKVIWIHLVKASLGGPWGRWVTMRRTLLLLRLLACHCRVVTH